MSALEFFALLRRPIVAALVALGFSLVVIFGGLGAPGLWEPQELAIADKVVLAMDRADPSTPAGKIAAQAKVADANKPELAPAPAKSSCEKTVPDERLARSFAPRATAFGIKTFGLSDFGMRMPFAIVGFVGLLALFGIGWRVSGARAGLLAVGVGLAMPLWVLSSRQLTSEIATATGGTLIVYGGLTLALRDSPWLSARGMFAAVSALLAVAAGCALGFIGGGALLGLLPPLLALAIMGGFGLPWLAASAKQLATALGRLRRGAPQMALPRAPRGSWVGVVATVGLVTCVGILASQLYAIKPPITGGREIASKSIVPSGCYAPAAGVVWQPDDNLRMTFESSVEQIGFGTLPWGIAAPLAAIMLLSSVSVRRRALATVAIAWAAGSWVVTEAFMRKAGFTIYAGFPAIAMVVGVWLDAIIEARQAPDSADQQAVPPAHLLAGLFVMLGMIVLAKDLQQFPERIASLLVGSDGIKFPAVATVLGTPAKKWIIVICAAIAIKFASANWLYRFPVWANRTLLASLGMSLVLALFWNFGWHRAMSEALSSKGIFANYQSLRKSGDILLLAGDLGNAPRYYAGGDVQKLVGGYPKLFEQFAAPTPRAFAVVPAADLCNVHREANGRPYYVLDDSNARSLLLSNSTAGSSDKNPLAMAVLRTEPADVGVRPAGRMLYDNKVEIVGWKIPSVVERGTKFQVTITYKVVAPVGNAYKVFFHVDGQAQRFNGDHEPIRGRCSTMYWKPGDYIVDTFVVNAPGTGFPTGMFEIWTGFFTGQNPNWKNMPVTAGPQGTRDNADRIKIATLRLR